MRRTNLICVWWAYFLGARTICISTCIASEFQRNSGKHTKPDCDQDREQEVSAKHLMRDGLFNVSYTRQASLRSRRSSENKDLGENRTSKLIEDFELTTSKPNLDLQNITAQKPTGLVPVHEDSEATSLGDSGFDSGLPGAHHTCVSPPDSCAGRCSNQTHLVSTELLSAPKCHCDTACNDVFMDCCSDYTTHCGSNAKEETDAVYLSRPYLHCQTEHVRITTLCERPAGMWMIVRCSKDWPDDVIRSKCHTRLTTVNSLTFDELVPVFSEGNNMTYRNQYCALCHNVTRFSFWSMLFNKDVVPPAQMSKSNLIEFMRKNAQFFRYVTPKHQQLRYCYFPKIVKTCPERTAPGKYSSDSLQAQCLSGSVEIVQWADSPFETPIFYKNRACSACHGVKSTCNVSLPRELSACIGDFELISRYVDLQNYQVSLATTVCARDQVYDPYLGLCRKRYRPFLRNSLKDSYSVILLLQKNSKLSRTFQRDMLRQALAKLFNVSSSQVKNVQMSEDSSMYIIRISFTLHLTTFQSLIVSSGFEDLNETLGLQRLFRFEKSFNVKLFGEREDTVFRVRLRRLACIHSRAYQHDEFVILGDKQLYVNSTGVIYDVRDYEVNRTNSRPVATVCLKLAPLQCNGSYVNLSLSEFRLLPNLTLVYGSSRYTFGEYTYENGKAFVCAPFKKKHSTTTLEKPTSASVLSIFNFVGFLLSIVCLLAVVVTYSIFKELRTLFGKNLVSLSISFALADLFWMIGSAFTKNQAACTGIAITDYYFYLVYFASSSVLAFDSCVVFGRSISLKRSPEEENKRFLAYFLATWLLPALFVLTFSLLDYCGLFIINYGGYGLCWLGSSGSVTFLFFVPFGVLILFNISLFAFMAVRLCRNRQSNSRMFNSEILRKRAKQNILICVKLSTLMSFSWLFLLIHVTVASKTVVFLYLFVFFVSLQGVFVSVAFLFNRRCLKLYRGLLVENFANSDTSSKNASTGKEINYTRETRA